MHTIILFLLLSFSIFFPFLPITASALEFEEKFDTDDYADTEGADMVRVDGGAVHTWDQFGGWSGGAAKFTPPTAGNNYSGLRNFGSVNARKVNIRFLYYIGSTYIGISDNVKWTIILREQIQIDTSNLTNLKSAHLATSVHLRDL